MIKNRFFKNTLGVNAEVVIAQALDSSAGTNTGTPATGTASVTVAATTTDGDKLILTVGSHQFVYASVGAVTAAAFGTALLAALNADAYFVAQGIVWTKAGTTSLVLTGTAPLGAQYNGIAVNFEAGSPNAGPSFSSFSSTNFTGGTTTTSGQTTYKAFVTNGVAGAISAFWDDTNLVVEPGTLSDPKNASRKFFYAWKQGDASITMRTTGIPSRVTYARAAYTAGTAQVERVGYGGTISVGQTIWVRIIDTTSKTIPYPTYEYSNKVTTDVNTSLVAIAALINAETVDPIVTAAVSTTNLDLTIVDKNNSFKVNGYIEVTAAQATDASAITYTHTTAGVAPLGTIADVKYLEQFFLKGNGAILYSGQENVNVDEFQTQYTNVVSGINYSFLVTTAQKVEFPQSSTHAFRNKAYVIIAAPAAATAYLASL